MPRRARVKSESGIYHIIMRGINRQTIFADEEDYAQFLQVLGRYKEISGYKIFAYCLMGNHVHILLQVGIEPLEQVMRRLCGSYVFWYNNKYQRVGNLFQDRFKSEPVEDDTYFQVVQRYIHQNPVKAGIVEAVKDYKWSSFREYINREDLVDTHFFLGMFSEDRKQAVQSFRKHVNELSDQCCLDIDNEKARRITDEEAREIIKTVCKVNQAMEMQNFDSMNKNIYLKKLKEEYGMSIRQLERLTGINRGCILRA